MNKLKLFLFSMLSFWIGIAQADIVENYTLDFNTSIDCYSDHAFKVASGWDHYVETYVDGGDASYVTYGWNQNDNYGVDGSACLMVGDQHNVFDMIVTPLVKGTVSLKVKRRINGTSYAPFISFYKMTRNGNTLEKAEKLSTNSVALENASDDYETVTVTLDDWTYVGIHGQWIFMDDFSASQADISLLPGMTLSYFSSNMTGTVTADDNGMFEINYTVKVDNTGEVTLEPGMENYSLLIRTNTGEIVATQPIEQTLAVGEKSDFISLTAQVNINDFPERTRYDVVNGLNTNDVQVFDSITPVSSNPVMAVGRTGFTGSIANNSTLDFGKSKAAVTFPLVVKNTGGADLIISEIVTPDGFTANVETPLTIATDASSVVNIVMNADVAGAKSGDLVIKSNIDDKTYALTGKIVADDVWFANFEDNTLPADMMADGSNWRTVMNYGEAITEVNKYVADNNGDADTRMVTPLMTVGEGAVLSFDAARKTSDNASLKVYYSANRSEWTLARTLGTTGVSEADMFSNTTIGESYAQSYELRNYSVDNIPAGQWYIAFEGANVQVDNIEAFPTATVDHDVVATAFAVPSTAVVNTSFKVSATFKNMLDVVEQTNDMTATFHFGDEELDLDPQSLTAGGSATYSFDFTAHQAGEKEAYFALRIGDYEVTTEVKTVTVGEEVASEEKVIGTANANYSDAPVNVYYRQSDSEIIYTAEKLGLTPGTKITRLAFHGYVATKDVPATVEAWIENTEDTECISNYTTMLPTDDLTKVFDGDYTFTAQGSSTNMVEIFAIDLAEPFVYTGNNLRLVFKKRASSDTTTRFECDNTDKTHCKERHKDNGNLEENSFSLVNLPVLYLGIEKSPVSVTGTVSADGQAIEGAKVSFVNDNVAYNGTTDAEGKYDITIMKDNLQYTMKVVKAGYNPYTQENVDVVATPVVDAELTEAQMLIIESVNIPASGTVNDEFTADVTVMNPLVDDIAADDYTVALYFDDEKVAETKQPVLAKEKSTKFRFAFYPHKAGNFNATVHLDYSDSNIVTDDADVTIAEEQSTMTVQVGEEKNITNSECALNTYYKSSATETVYPASLLNLPAGTKIKSISFEGYANGTKSYQAYQSVFLANTDDELNTTTPTPTDTLTMTRVFGKNVQLNFTTGNASNTSTVLQFVFDEPFVYTGGNLRAFFYSSADTYQRVYFKTDNTQKSITKAADSNFDAATWKFTDMAVAFMEVEVENAIEGVVTSFRTSEPIADAAVTFKSGGVEYYGTTDAEGKYAVNVMKTDLNYTVTVVADGYVDDVQQFAYATSEMPLVHQMKQQITLSGVVTDAETSEALADVNITLMSGDDVAAETTTDEEGNYSITLIENADNSYSLAAVKEGYYDFDDDVTLSDLTTEKNFTMMKLRNIVSGTITNSAGAAIEGATVTVSADGITLGATTDSEGKYEITVISADGDYTFDVAKEGYENFTTTITFAGEDLTQDAVLYTYEELGIGGIAADGTTISVTPNGIIVESGEATVVNVYTYAGQLVRSERVAAGKVTIELPQGIYIVNGNKITVK